MLRRQADACTAGAAGAARLGAVCERLAAARHTRHGMQCKPALQQQQERGGSLAGGLAARTAVGAGVGHPAERLHCLRHKLEVVLVGAAEKGQGRDTKFQVGSRGGAAQAVPDRRCPKACRHPRQAAAARAQVCSEGIWLTCAAPPPGRRQPSSAPPPAAPAAAAPRHPASAGQAEGLPVAVEAGMSNRWRSTGPHQEEAQW